MRPASLGTRRLPLALAVSAATALTFLPAVGFPFLDWDDNANVVLNAHLALPWRQSLRWLATTHFMGPYQPLSWLTLAVDRAVWGLDPFGFHLTNIVLHAVNAGLFFLVARRLLERSFARSLKAEAVGWLAAFAALFFALHPLRVESVAWVTERRDVLSGLFFLGSLYAYLAERKGASLGLFALALLSKATAVGLVWALLAIDVYPLGRLPLDPRRWLSASYRGVLIEKAPYAALAAAVGLVNLLGFSTGELPTTDWGMGARAAFFLYGAAFYPLKTLWPAGLSVYYPLPITLSAMAGPLAVHAVLAAAATGLALALRRRNPAAPAAWACYLLTLAPVSGLLQNGAQIAADRYSYLACMPFALLAAGGLVWLSRRASAKAAAAAGCAVLAGLVVMTRTELPYWRSDRALWARAVALDPDNYMARSNLATDFFKHGDAEAARVQYEETLKLDPRDTHAHLNLGDLEERRGDYAAALRHFEIVLIREPRHWEARNNMAVALIKLGQWQEATKILEDVVSERPDDAQPRFNLGALLAEHGRREEGLGHLRLALLRQPELGSRLPAGLRRDVGQR